MFGPTLLLMVIGSGFTPVSDVEVRCLENLRGKVGRARVEIVVAAGALHEDDDARGVAHLLEHLLLRPLGFDDSNGATAWDYTTYYRDVHGAELSTAAVDLARAVAKATFTDEVFETEKQIVLRELTERHAPDRFEQDPIFSGTILERTPGGTLQAVRDLAPEDARKFHAKHYVTGNVAVLLSGAVSCDQLRESVREPLAKFSRGAASPVVRVSDKEHGAIALGPSEDLLAQGYYWFDASPREEVVWQLVAKHLEQTALDELRKARGMTYSPSARVQRRGAGGMLELQVKTDGRAGEAATWFDEKIANLRTTSTPKEEMAAAFKPVRDAFTDDGVRIALAKIHGEPAPLELLDALDDATLAADLQSMLVDRRSFGTASATTNIWSLIILLLFGVLVAGGITYAVREFAKS